MSLHNHSFMLAPDAGMGRTTGNPVYEDQIEGVSLWAKGRSVILFNAILDGQHRFVMGANKAYAIPRLMRKAHFILVTGLDRELAKALLFEGAVDTVDEALKLAMTYVGPAPKYMLMPTGSLTVPMFHGKIRLKQHHLF